MAKAAVAAGADGLMVEVHNNPECALCDGAQSLKPEKYDTLLHQVKQIAEVVGKNSVNFPKRGLTLSKRGLTPFAKLICKGDTTHEIDS